ncbi:hypothetical protein [Gilvibacter sp.]|uniref:hypothetical protein n=1 Tax=Gilvibacter sp. TaxID=2729997 RepID=UPI003B52CF6B
MKLLKLTLSLILLSGIFFTSCRTEESEIINPSIEETLEANSTIAGLMQRVSLSDGSLDNIIDSANCFTINLPVTVIVNGIEVTVNTEADYELIEDILDESDDDTDTVEIVFPITVTLADYTEVTLNSIEEFLALAITCPDEDEDDDDIECLDFVYPITATIFNPVTEELETIVIENDEQMYAFLEMIEDSDVVTVEFPISVILADGTTVVIEDLEELEAVIEEAEDSCDEDDDYDYDDDDCEDCTTDDLGDLLTGCSPWFVDKLELDDEDLEDAYVGYLFTFTEDGMIIVETATDEFTGAWASSGAGEAITVEIDIPDLPDFNANWILHEIDDEPGEFQVDLRLGDDRLRFESDCEGSGGGDPDPDAEALEAALATGAWFVTNYFDDVDQTDLFCGYTFEFGADGSAAAVNGDETVPGTWAVTSDDSGLDLVLNFGEAVPFDELLDNWDVIEFSETIIRLRDISGGDGSEDLLTFGREPVSCDDPVLEGILADGTWVVALYMDGPANETATFAAYQLAFNADGTLIAESDTDTVDGTWEVIGADTVLVLNFGGDIPFDELEDDWDVFSVEADRVELRDVSGGDGELDVLVFEKL